MTAQEVAAHLQLSTTHHLYRWVESGRMPVVRLGYTLRFRPSDIKEFEEQALVPAFRTRRKRATA